MELKNYTVYVHGFPDGKKYVGLTKQTCRQRWGSHGQGYKDQPVYEAILKYGWDNVTHEVFTDLTREEAREKEKELILKYDSINNGYNVAKGGDCGGNPWVLFTYDGKEYIADELAAISPIKGMTGHSIVNRINCRNKTIEEAINSPIQKRKYKVEYNGKYYTFKELEQLTSVEGLTAKKIRDRISRGWTVERAITQSLDTKLQPFGVTGDKFEYNGNMLSVYELWLMRKCEDITQQNLSHRLHQGWDVDRALSQPRKQYNVLYEYDGNQLTVEDIIKLNPDLSNHDVTDRLRNGWSIEKIISTPLQHKKKYLYNNEMMSLKQIYNLSKQHTCSYTVFTQRIKNGMTIEEAL